MRRGALAAPMSAASRVQLVPAARMSEDELMAAARALDPPRKPIRPGDALGPLVVVAVDPAPGSAAGKDTEWEIAPEPRRRDAPMVDVAILLDVSESMGLPWDEKHARLEAALVSLSSFPGSGGATTADVSVYHYAKHAQLRAGPSPAREIKMIPTAAPKGRSDTGAALDAALAGLASRTRADRSQVVLLLTDGIGNVDGLRAAGERAKHLQVPVHCLVFAPEVDAEFDALAATTGGSVQAAAHPLTLEFVHQPGDDA